MHLFGVLSFADETIDLGIGFPLDSRLAGIVHLPVDSYGCGERFGADEAKGACVALSDLCRLSGALSLFPVSHDDAFLVDRALDGGLYGLALGALHQLFLEDQCPHDRYRRVAGRLDGGVADPLGQSLSGFHGRAVDCRFVRHVANFSKKTYAIAGVRRI